MSRKRVALFFCATLVFACSSADSTPKGSTAPTKQARPASHSISGSVTGLVGGGLILLLNGEHELAVTKSGSFTFQTALNHGDPYAVSVLEQPRDPSQTCDVKNAEGDVASDVTGIAITCTTNVFHIGGSATGLTGSGLMLRLNDGEVLTVAANGPFQFTNKLEDSTDYRVTVAAHPARQSCVLTGGDGRLAGADITGIQVACGQVTWAQLAAGYSHTCAITPDGRLFCWGSGAFGKLGDGSGITRFSPTQESSKAGDWISVAAGESHTCAVRQSGKLYCWGHGLEGQLGTPSLSSADPEQESTQAEDWVAVTAGARHTCALKTSGAIFCWGDGGSGQLGNLGWSDSNVPVQENSEALDWAVVVAGSWHTCARKQDGRLFCWGQGNSGQLGTNTGSRSVPTQEATLSTEWSSVTAGQSHTCAIKEDSSMHCWGLGNSGQLGTGFDTSSPTPATEYTQAKDWLQVSAHFGRTCALKQDGRIFCWGDGLNFFIHPDSEDNRLQPTAVHAGATGWIHVSVGRDHACALRESGEAFCWGARAAGRLGDGVPWIEAPDSVTPAVSVAAGYAHTCVLQADGRVKCFGRGLEGQLGNNALVNTLTPQAEFMEAANWTSLSANYQQTCGVNDARKLYCWGRGTEGQLGDGNKVSSPVPVSEATASNAWATVTVGGTHACALKTDGRIFCWGQGASGQLGSGANAESLTPVSEATASTDWHQVSAGLSFTCATKQSGALYCWGDGSYGQLGTGSTELSNRPFEEATESRDWAQVSAGRTHACAVKQGGSLFCWGRGDKGQLGIGAAGSALIPTQEATAATDWAAVAAGDAFTCARKIDGRLYCWGDGGDGQFGAPTALTYSPLQEATQARAALAAGWDHVVAIKADGRVFATGADWYGELGGGRPLVQVKP